MKLLRQALDWRNPRSLWYRSVCQCFGSAIHMMCVAVGVPTACFALCFLVVHLLLDVTLPLLCRVPITFGLDDSDDALQGLLNATQHDPFSLQQKAPRFTEAEQILLLASYIVYCIYKAGRLWFAEHRWHALLLCVMLLLSPLLPALLMLLLSSVGSAFLMGCMGTVFDIMDLIGNALGVRAQTHPFSVVAAMRYAVPALVAQSHGFYTLIGAAGVVLGTAIGVTIMTLMLCALILALPYYCCIRMHQDVQETLHDLV